MPKKDSSDFCAGALSVNHFVVYLFNRWSFFSEDNMWRLAVCIYGMGVWLALTRFRSGKLAPRMKTCAL